MLLLNFIKSKKKKVWKVSMFSPPLGEMPQAEGNISPVRKPWFSPPLGEMPQAEGVSSQS
jgi:hypothetical protein